jgi:predicted aspartyl protease
MKSARSVSVWVVLMFVAALCWASAVQAGRSDWQRSEVNWRVIGGTHIKAINYPGEKPVPTFAQRKARKPAVAREKIIPVEAVFGFESTIQQSTGPIFADVIDSPPIDGFVPWIAVSITDARSYEDLDIYAVPQDYVSGNFLTPNPETDYTIGIFDTGASAHLISDDAATLTGIYDSELVTSSVVELIGATGSAYALASQPLGVFIGSIGNIDSNGLLTDTAGMVGESNLSIIVGDPVDSPNLPTAVGSPLAAYFAVSFRNDRQITVSYDGNDFTAPDISFYDLSDSCIPVYANKINLQLRPSDGAVVAYFPCVEIWPGDCPDGDGSPQIPSTIWGFLPTQSLYFLPRVDLVEGKDSALYNNNFMFDTGAQVTVISETVAAQLRLNVAQPEFTAEIQGVTGDVTIVPGFYIDSLEIPATGEWLSLTNVPVVMLDVDSPEGGILDGIIGMNLFIDLNFVFRGGGLMGQGYNPFIHFEPACRLVGNIAPDSGDCAVDFFDIAALAEAWLATPQSSNWNRWADLAPPAPDDIINFLDFAMIAEHWGETSEP